VFICDGLGLLVLAAATRKELKRVTWHADTRGNPVFARQGARYISNIDNINVLDMKTLEVAVHLTSGKHPEGMALVGGIAQVPGSVHAL